MKVINCDNMSGITLTDEQALEVAGAVKAGRIDGVDWLQDADAEGDLCLDTRQFKAVMRYLKTLNNDGT
jgi:hypothetical protein